MIASTMIPRNDEELHDWAAIVAPMEAIERTLHIASKAEALAGIIDDPLARCHDAVEDARERLDAGLITLPEPLEPIGSNGHGASEFGNLELSKSGEAPASPPVPAGRMFIDWTAFWDRDHDEVEWVFPDVLARGRGHALYAAHKMGKSLFMLYVAAQLATGNEPIVVVYLDYEMSEADIFDRLEDMGYGPDNDFSRLLYALLPTLPPLDTATGAEALTELVDRAQSKWPDHHIVVIIDTISRAVRGEENSADTFRDFYSHTGIELKRRGVTWARLDHGGKDPAQGQRGSSSKGDDVDVVWKLTRTENGVCLHRELARMPWVPESVTFRLTDEPLAYTRLADDWPAGTGETANLLDRLEVAPDASARTAQTALREVNEGRRKQVVVAALRWRRERLAGM